MSRTAKKLDVQDIKPGLYRLTTSPENPAWDKRMVNEWVCEQYWRQGLYVVESDYKQRVRRLKSCIEDAREDGIVIPEEDVQERMANCRKGATVNIRFEGCFGRVEEPCDVKSESMSKTRVAKWVKSWNSLVNALEPAQVDSIHAWRTSREVGGEWLESILQQLLDANHISLFDVQEAYTTVYNRPEE